MDIESFYEQNEARRESAEFEFGDEWTDASDNDYELSWVEATGELYLMVEPDAVVSEDIFGDFRVSDEPVERPDGRDHRSPARSRRSRTLSRAGRTRCSRRTHSPGSTSASRGRPAQDG